MSESSEQTELKMTVPRRPPSGGSGYAEWFRECVTSFIRRRETKAYSFWETRPSTFEDWALERSSRVRDELALWREYPQALHEVENDWFISGRLVGAATTDLGLPQVDQHRLQLELEQVKTQLIGERRNALVSARRESQLMETNENLAVSLKGLVEAQRTLLMAFTANAQARVCLHERYVGTVSEIVGSQVKIVYDSEDRTSIKQVYDLDQFEKGYKPHEGESLHAFVLVACGVSRPMLEDAKSTDAGSDFSGFSNSVNTDIEL